MNVLIKSAALLLAAGFCLPAQAHKSWLPPSSTVLSDAGSLTVEAAVSNDLFYFEHNPLRLDTLRITALESSAVQPENAWTVTFRSSFGLPLAQSGTYRSPPSPMGCWPA